MPGRRRRKQRQQREGERNRPDTVPGRWEPVFSTQEHAELREFVRRLHEEGTVTDPSRLRIDLFCGRHTHPSSYQVSVYVPDASA
ncbi:hypothetical protein ACFWFZ_10275 [Streptomyces sp. NPDC060232]|uniref:hypothetical protein n=1 Tax=Streptomyces sp. NPDC060232 TaxID=3347079 RepID=UPI0036558C20